MIRVENPLGRIELSQNYFAELVSHAAQSCFGVVGMVASGASQGLRNMTGVDVPHKGVFVRSVDGKLNIDLHIEVAYGVNINAIVRSIISEVRYTVEQATGLKVGRVEVFVDAMRNE